MQGLAAIRPRVNADISGSEPGWWTRLPVSINCAYGDPLIRQQEQDTAIKLSHLAESEHQAPFGFCTKGLLSKAGEALFRTLPPSPNYVFRYSLTGLDEAKYDFDARVDTIHRLGAIFGKEKIIISPRPIIAGRNDDEANLARIVKVAADTSRVLIVGGFHDPWKHKLVSERVDKFLKDECDANGVRYFYKSSCSSSFVTGTACWMHDLGTPRNLAVLEQFGFAYELDESGDTPVVVLDQATTGDLNFVRAVTASLPRTKRLISNYNLISASPARIDVEQTSSWYVWARNLPQCLNCDYCIINDIEYLEQERKDVGVQPHQLAETLGVVHREPPAAKGGAAQVSSPDGNKDRVDYTMVRIVKPCRRYAYQDAV